MNRGLINYGLYSIIPYLTPTKPNYYAMPLKNSTPWRLCCAAAIGVTLLSFSPIVLPLGEIEPKLGEVPYTLWMGIALTIVLVLLTYIGFKVHPGHQEGGEES